MAKDLCGGERVNPVKRSGKGGSLKNGSIRKRKSKKKKGRDNTPSEFVEALLINPPRRIMEEKNNAGWENWGIRWSGGQLHIPSSTYQLVEPKQRKKEEGIRARSSGGRDRGQKGWKVCAVDRSGDNLGGEEMGAGQRENIRLVDTRGVS